jgi:DNA-binding NtrC family response regulator
LEATRHYEFTCTRDLQAVRTLMRWDPLLVLLHVPEEKGKAEDAFDCLDTLKDQLPVVVMSTAADAGLYLVAMTRGAFDYFTSYTPLDEVMQILNGAVRWQRAQAA